MYFSLQAWLLAASHKTDEATLSASEFKGQLARMRITRNYRVRTYKAGTTALLAPATQSAHHSKHTARASSAPRHERFTNGQVQQARRPQSAKYFAQHCASNDLGRSEIQKSSGGASMPPDPPRGRSSSDAQATRNHRLSTPLPAFLNTPLWCVLIGARKYTCILVIVGVRKYT